MDIINLCENLAFIKSPNGLCNAVDVGFSDQVEPSHKAQCIIVIVNSDVFMGVATIVVSEDKGVLGKQVADMVYYLLVGLFELFVLEEAILIEKGG